MKLPIFLRLCRAQRAGQGCGVLISDFLRSLRQRIPGCERLLCKRETVGSQICVRSLAHRAAEAADKMVLFQMDSCGKLRNMKRRGIVVPDAAQCLGYDFIRIEREGAFFVQQAQRQRQ